MRVSHDFTVLSQVNRAARFVAWVSAWNAGSPSMASLIAAVARFFAKTTWKLFLMPNRSGKFDIVIVGAGPAGLAAACAAAESDATIAVVDETSWLGGQIWRGSKTQATNSQARKWIEQFRQTKAIVLDRTMVLASPQAGVLLAERDQKPLQIHFNKLILATGARELFLPFPGWTLPGVLGPGGLQSLAKNGWPVAGKRIVIAGSGPLLLAVAVGLKRLGATIVSISEQASQTSVTRFALSLFRYPAKIWQGIQLKLQLTGIPYRHGVWPVRAEGDQQIERAILTDGQNIWTEQCDFLACGFGLVPNVELPLALGCELKDGFVWADSNQATSVPNIYCAGEPTGIGGADCAIVEGQIAGYAATNHNTKAQALFSQRASWHRFRTALACTFALRPELKSLATDETLLCRCEDVTFGRVRQFNGWRDAKLQTRCGMGACQGRICGAACKVIFGWGMESVRPPVLPALVGSLVSQPAESAEKTEHNEETSTISDALSRSTDRQPALNPVTES
jgi:NADPH-dependent 2,4-dienoyl-CoA reductase/sulfur reductase-like enzyme